jgi:hypothetical protein
MAKTWRDTIRQVSPPWLRTGVAEKLLYAIAIQFDALTDAAVAAVKIRFPGLYSDESLPLIGRERRISRGRVEPSPTYAARLVRWWTDHKTRGNPYAMLAQLHAYYAPNNFPVRLVYRSGRAFDMDTAGNVTMSDVTWNPDTQPEKWARWWLIFDWPTELPAKRKWGDTGLKWGVGGHVWGSGLTAQDVRDLRLVPKEWNAAHPQGQLILKHGGTIWGAPGLKWGATGLKWGGGMSVRLSVE